MPRARLLFASGKCRIIRRQSVYSRAERMSLRRTRYALIALTALAAVGDAGAGALREQVERAAQQNFGEFDRETRFA